MDKKDFTCKLKKLSRSKKARADIALCALERLYPDAECSLEYEGDPYRLLVMSRLSAQCTDARVNIVAKSLFARFPDCAAMANADLDEIEKLVHSCGVYKVKAKNISDMSKILMEKYGGEVPKTKEALMALPGIGQKIANLMLGDVFGDPRIVPDTHMIRLANRFGLASSTNPDIVERSLREIIPKAEQSAFCHRAVLFGREYCRARSPRCADCPLCDKE